MKRLCLFVHRRLLVLLALLVPLAVVYGAEPGGVPAGWTPLRIRILDEQGKPIDAFTYQFHLKWKQEVPEPKDAVPLKGQHGEIEITAPEACEVSVSIDTPDAVRGYGTEAVVERKAGEAVLDAKFQLGHRVTGTVIDAATGQPVAGAMVAPLVFTPPLFTPDEERAVRTKADGSFELRGVASSFAVEDPSFTEQEIYLDEKNPEKPQTVKLRAGETLRGVVTGADHRPLAGVSVDDGSGKKATTDKEGRFLLKGLRKWSGNEWALSFAKAGYNDKDFRAERVDPGGLQIQLDALPHLHGTVVLPDGSPATNYQLVCAPGPHPVDYRAVKLDVRDKEGRFDLQPDALPEEGGKYWIGVRAEGSAPWDGLVGADELTKTGLRVVLEAGVTLSARFEAAGLRAGELQVSLTPTDRRPEESYVVTENPGTALATRETRLKPGAALRLEHLRAGEYLLAVQGAGVTPVSRPVTIGQADVDLGQVKLPGVGSIFGVVHRPEDPKKVWRFAEGEIYLSGFGSEHGPLKKFKADERGRFRVEDVPTGEITVAFPYMVTADMGETVSRQARVAAGENTEVRFEGQGGGWTQPVRLRFDGQDTPPADHGIRKVDNVTDRPEFTLEVTPLSPGPSSGPASVEGEAKGGANGLDIPDLSPGRWRVRVYDWLGSRGNMEGLRGEATAEVPAGERQPISIELATHTLSGKVSTTTPYKRYVAVEAVSEPDKRVFHSRCDQAGNFVIRYLPKGEYTVHAHDDQAGWCDLGTFRLDKPLVDCGEHVLVKGGSVTGVLSRTLLPLADETAVKAVAPDGVEILVDEVKADGTYEFGQMRPGPWVVEFPGNDGQVEHRAVEIRAGQTMKLAGGKKT